MKTTQNTNTYTIALTEITPDYDDATRLELSFTATLSYAYALTTAFAADDPTTLAEIYDNDSITYEFNVASRHDNDIYANFLHDTGDTFDTESFIFTFGQPAYDFIADTCKLLNVPL